MRGLIPSEMPRVVETKVKTVSESELLTRRMLSVKSSL